MHVARCLDRNGCEEVDLLGERMTASRAGVRASNRSALTCRICILLPCMVHLEAALLHSGCALASYLFSVCSISISPKCMAGQSNLHESATVILSLCLLRMYPQVKHS